MSTSVPFEIASAGPVSVASNGASLITIWPAEGGRLFRRRAVNVTTGAPPAERVLPPLNQLAGELRAQIDALNDMAQELLQEIDLPAAVVSARLHALAQAIAPKPAIHHEWAVAELDGVRAYFDGTKVMLTRQELLP